MLRKQLVHLTLKDTWIGILTSECTLLSYLILIGKIYSSSCRRNEVLPNTVSFIVRVNIKDETEKHISTKNTSLQKVMEKWTLQSNLVFLCVCVRVCVCVCVATASL